MDGLCHSCSRKFSLAIARRLAENHIQRRRFIPTVITSRGSKNRTSPGQKPTGDRRFRILTRPQPSRSVQQDPLSTAKTFFWSSKFSSRPRKQNGCKQPPEVMVTPSAFLCRQHGQSC